MYSSLADLHSLITSGSGFWTKLVKQDQDKSEQTGHDPNDNDLQESVSSAGEDSLNTEVQAGEEECEQPLPRHVVVMRRYFPDLVSQIKPRDSLLHQLLKHGVLTINKKQELQVKN